MEKQVTIAVPVSLVSDVARALEERAAALETTRAGMVSRYVRIATLDPVAASFAHHAARSMADRSNTLTAIATRIRREAGIG